MEKEEIYNFIKNNILTKLGEIAPSRANRRWFEDHNYMDYFNSICNITSFLPDTAGITIRCGFILNNKYELPKCKVCDNTTYKLHYTSYSKIRTYCSSICMGSDSLLREKREQTCLDRHGVKCILGTDIAKNGVIKKYGVDNVNKVKEIYEKSKQARLKKYGVENAGQIESGKIKSKQTKLKKYGNENYVNIEKCKETFKKNHPGMNDIMQIARESFKEQYKVENPSQVKEIQEKKKQNGLKKYGVLFQQKHLTKESINKLKDINYIKSHNIGYIMNDTGVSYTTVIRTIRSMGLSDGYKSELERDIAEFLKENNINFISNSRSYIKPLEIDFFIPEINIGIEVDSIYLHSDINIPNDYHLIKTNKCEEKNIQLLHIFEHEMINNNKFNIWKSIILNKLNKTQKIYGRKCKIILINDTDTIKSFYNNNHIQGYVNSKYNYGLIYNDKIVGMMSFSKSRFNSEYEYEMTRFCNLNNTTVLGGASKLFNHFLKNIEPISIISYADRRYSIGKLYNNLGFQFLYNSKPNYYYFNMSNPIKLFNRIHFQKHKLKNILEIYDENLTEVENMYNNRYRRIFDSGNKVYIHKNQ